MVCEDYAEFKHYVNDIKKSVTPNSEILTRLSDENIFKKKKKIKSLEEEMKELKNRNATLRENMVTQLKIIENFSGNNETREDQSIFTLKPATNSFHCWRKM